MKNKVAIYCRLSNEDNDKIIKNETSESIQNQNLLLIEYAKKQDWDIYNIYIDDDYSGLDNNRPSFNRMIEDAKNHRFDILLCKNQSRFSRDMEIIEKYLHNLFILWNIRFVGLVDNVDTVFKGGKKSRQINGLVNEWYCEDISENVKSAINTKKHNGQYLGHWCTYGYELDKTDKHKIVVDEYAANIVVEIYNLYLLGYGIAAIATILTERQISTPSVYKRLNGKNYRNPSENKSAYSSKYGVWATNTIRRILRDKTYLGHLIQGRERKVSYKIDKIIKVPESEWIVVENNHKPIVDIDTFTKVQNRFGVRGISKKNGIFSKTHIFAGKVRCMKCGCNMNKRHGKNKVLYLKCGLAIKTKNRDCTLHTIRIDYLTKEITNQIHSIITKYISNQENRFLLLEYYFNKNNYKKELQQKNFLYKDSLKHKDNISKAISTSYLEKINGTLTDKSFEMLNSNFENELNQINIKLSDLKKSINDLEKKINESNTDTFEIENYIYFSELTQEIINNFIDFIEIGEANKDGEQAINIYWLF